MNDNRFDPTENNQDFIQFKKQRDLGAILSDIFKFIRLEWKPLFGLILKIAGPALLLLVIAFVFYMQTTFGSLGLLAGGDLPFDNFTGTLVIALFVMIFAGIVFYSLLYGTVVEYVKSYVINNGNADAKDVIAGIKHNFWSLLGLSFLVGLITLMGTIFCIIPGIYLGTVLATTYCIHLIENRDATDSISYSFNLIKGEWWNTFATFLVIFILYYFVGLIFQVPQLIYMFIQGIAMSQDATADPTQLFDWVYLTLNGIAMIFQYLLYTIIVLGTCFVYYDLNERKNFSGTLETIDTLGQ